MSGSILPPMSSLRPSRLLQNEWQEEREGLYQMLDEKDKEILKKSERMEMLVKERQGQASHRATKRKVKDAPQNLSGEQGKEEEPGGGAGQATRAGIAATLRSSPMLPCRYPGHHPDR